MMGIQQKWKDQFLQWGYGEFKNINGIILKPSEIWTPDLVLYKCVKP